MSYKPTYNRLLIERLEDEKGLIELNADKNPFSLAKILKVGPTAGQRNDKVFHAFQADDKIVYHRGQAIHVTVGAETFVLLDDDKVLALVD